MRLKYLFNRTARFGWAAFFTFSLASSARMEEYFVSGMAQVDTSGLKVNNIYLGSWGYKASFEISVRDGLWVLRTQRKDEIDYVEYGTDGTDIFELNSLANSNEHRKKEGEQVGVNDAVGMIEHDSMPLAFFRPHVAILWFAYASAGYLNGVENGQLRPVFYPDLAVSPLHRRDFKVNAQLKRFTDDPKLPQEVIFLDDGKERSFGRQDRYALSDPLVATRLPPYDAGFTNGIYRILSSTNIGTMRLPVSLVYEHYLPSPEGTGTTNRTTYRFATITINATMVSPKVSRASMIPEIIGVTTVQELRLLRQKEKVAVFSYDIRKKWPSLKEVESFPEYREIFGFQN